MDLQPESTDRPVAASLKATYRALLARGLEAGEAANLTAFLHGLPSTGFRWSLTEVEAIVQQRITYAAELRREAIAAGALTATAPRARRPGGPRQPSRAGSMPAIDPPSS